MQWSCTLCSYNNDEPDTLCLICEAPRVHGEQKACDICTFLNQAGAKRCEMCESPFITLNIDSNQGKEKVVVSNMMCTEVVKRPVEDKEIESSKRMKVAEVLIHDLYEEAHIEEFTFDSQDVEEHDNVLVPVVDEIVVEKSLKQRLTTTSLEYTPYVPYNSAKRCPSVVAENDMYNNSQNDRNNKDFSNNISQNDAGKPKIKTKETKSKLLNIADSVTSSSNPNTNTNTSMLSPDSNKPMPPFTFHVEVSSTLRSAYDQILDSRLILQPDATSHQGLLLSAYSKDKVLFASLSIHVHSVNAVMQVPTAQDLYKGITAHNHLVIIPVEDTEITHRFLAREKVLGIRSVEHLTSMCLYDTQEHKTAYHFEHPLKVYRYIEMACKGFARYWEKPLNNALVELEPVHTHLKHPMAKAYLQLPMVSTATAEFLHKTFPSMASLVQGQKAQAETVGKKQLKQYRFTSADSNNYIQLNNMVQYQASMTGHSARCLGGMAAKAIVTQLQEALEEQRQRG